MLHEICNEINIICTSDDANIYKIFIRLIGYTYYMLSLWGDNSNVSKDC